MDALVEDHGVGSLDSIVANVAFLVGHVVQDQGSHFLGARATGTTRP